MCYYTVNDNDQDYVFFGYFLIKNRECDILYLIMFFQEKGSNIWDSDEANEYLNRQAESLEFKM